jgi:hypothetical protein
MLTISDYYFGAEALVCDLSGIEQTKEEKNACVDFFTMAFRCGINLATDTLSEKREKLLRLNNQQLCDTLFTIRFQLHCLARKRQTQQRNTYPWL